MIAVICSMTGYGRSENTLNNRKITVELRSVNHRFLEFSCRVPRGYLFLEEYLKALVSKRVYRGKVEMFVSIEDGNEAECGVTVNHSSAAQYIADVKDIAEKNVIEPRISALDVARMPEVLTVRKVDDEDFEAYQKAIWNDVSTVAEAALDAFVNMRKTEGESLRRDVESRVEFIYSAVERIEAEAPKTVDNYAERLKEKITEFLAGAQVDEQRLLTEVAVFADRVAIDEETVRLRSHLAQITEMVNSDNSVGRKLDFILQEANREINTIGSKAQNSDIAKVVVDVKAEFEKIREQIQNIE